MKTVPSLIHEHELLAEQKSTNTLFNAHDVIHDLKHYLPAQAPLKDFIHHNTLHAFQHKPFHQAIHEASTIFGYKVSLTIDEYREFYQSGRIREDILEKVIEQRKGTKQAKEWKEKLLTWKYNASDSPRIGFLRANWKKYYKIDLDSLVHPILFRILCSYLDQGIAMWNFPVWQNGFLASLKEMERNSFTSFFRKDRAKKMLLNDECAIDSLLEMVVGDETLYTQYLYDQQFAHQGWSGMVSAIEDQPQTLVDPRKISLHDLIVFELLLEIDALDFQFGNDWKPLRSRLITHPTDLFAPVPFTSYDEAIAIWQEAFEWSYYDQVLAGIGLQKQTHKNISPKSFQAMFCIDDRECSFRRYLEKFDPACETFGTPGFFGVEFFFQPEHGKTYTKLCPAPVTPKYLIKEAGTKGKRQKDVHFTKHTHSLFRGLLITQTLGFWSAFKLFLNIFRPSMNPATASSFRHMDKYSLLTIENKDASHRENELQIGFTVEEMAIRVENLLKSIGLVKDFAPVIYVIGHGSSSINNPHYAAYDCGACSGRPGSVNARVICYMANHPEVRAILRSRGMEIPAEIQFLGGLHDTTRDEVAFYDENSLSSKNQEIHRKNETVFNKALDHNAKERSRRFESINSKESPAYIHNKVKRRSVSLFEPRPELNHATNALCIVGKRELSKGLFLDRRSFMNSFDYQVDPEGKYLFNILKAAAPVCGGINLEYFFSRVDNHKLGAGTKLPHNVMGLFGVANGIDGDLRPGLPSQMIEVHDPVRLMIIVEHFPDVVLKTIQKSPETYEWFINEWVHLVAVHPETREFYVFREGNFTPYQPITQKLEAVADITPIIEVQQDNLPVYLLS
ncbi:DUF2309 domain-containing protein [Rhodocytophaga rosea]|uniref:Probable inorganic carbon transporter subunit DabA n=1 Tax=Rhodocytophaga rosea TaxID=2704465 RepID=A0A6C0GNB0_9BACT|nr:DUF2309 domain-containing protein [Rhodocytophaga rosea]QHT69515.1 DUF2309 domain-containing protein [Rhodocytophaga rosea]